MGSINEPLGGILGDEKRENKRLFLMADIGIVESDRWGFIFIFYFPHIKCKATPRHNQFEKLKL